MFSDDYDDYSFFPQTRTDDGFLLQSSDNAPAQAAPTQRVVEVAIPDVGTFVIESEEGGYDDEVPLIALVCTTLPWCFLCCLMRIFGMFAHCDT